MLVDVITLYFLTVRRENIYFFLLIQDSKKKNAYILLNEAVKTGIKEITPNSIYCVKQKVHLAIECKRRSFAKNPSLFIGKLNTKG